MTAAGKRNTSSRELPAVQTMHRTQDGTSPIPNKMGRRIPYPGGTSSPSSGTQEMALKHIRACAPKFTPRFYDMHGNIQAKECDRREGSTGFCENESTSSISSSPTSTTNPSVGMAQRHGSKGHGEDQGWGQRTLAQDKDQGQGASLFSQYHRSARVSSIYASLRVHHPNACKDQNYLRFAATLPDKRLSPKIGARKSACQVSQPGSADRFSVRRSTQSFSRQQRHYLLLPHLCGHNT